MRVFYILVVLVLLLFGCGTSKNNISNRNYEINKVDHELSSGGNQIKIKNKFDTISGPGLKFNLKKYNAWIERDLFLGNEKILSGMNQVMKQIKNNVQVFNQQGLEEFKKMLALHEENLILMQKLVSLQKKRYECFVKKYDLLNSKHILNNLKQGINRISDNVESARDKGERVGNSMKKIEEKKVLNKQSGIMKETKPVKNNDAQTQVTGNTQTYSGNNQVSDNALKQNNLKNKDSINTKANSGF